MALLIGGDSPTKRWLLSCYSAHVIYPYECHFLRFAPAAAAGGPRLFKNGIFVSPIILFIFMSEELVFVLLQDENGWAISDIGFFCCWWERSLCRREKATIYHFHRARHILHDVLEASYCSDDTINRRTNLLYNLLTFPAQHITILSSNYGPLFLFVKIDRHSYRIKWLYSGDRV